MVKTATIANWMEQIAPAKFAMDQDPIGWQIYDPNQEVSDVLITLEVTDAVIREAIAKKVSLIIAHHPLFFRPLKSLRLDDSKGKMIANCIQHGISVFAAHTNLDVVQNGLNDWLALRCGLQKIRMFSQTRSDAHCKIVVYVPNEHVEQVATAMFSAGAGQIGEYSHCSFRLEGTGTFFSNEGTDPFVGQVGEMSKVAEVRLETIVPEQKRRAVIEAMKKAHPYEEVAYDVFALHEISEINGIGRIGELPEPISLQEYAHQLKKNFGLEGLRICGEPTRLIRSVAVLGGAGRSYWKEAQRKGADVYITGDIDYHTAVDAQEAGFALIDPGHHIESIMQLGLAERLREIAIQTQQNVSFHVFSGDHQPFRFV